MTEINLKEPMNLNREAMVSIIRTSSILMRAAGRFFLKFVVTEVQFNILMLLKDEKAGLSQQEISERLIVTKSNVVGLIDRLEKSGLVRRVSDPGDRRLNRVILTSKGRNVLKSIENDYIEEVNRMMASISNPEKKTVVSATEKIREYLRQNWES